MGNTWLAVDARTGQVRADLPSFAVDKVSRSICQYDQANGILPISKAPRNWEQATTPGEIALIMLTDGVVNPLWGGLISQRIRGIDDGMTLSMATIEAYLDRRFVGDSIYTGTGQNALVADLVARFIVLGGALGGVPLRVAYVGTDGAGAPQNRTYLDIADKSVYSVMNELSGMTGGPQWTIEWEYQSNPVRYTPVLLIGNRIGKAIVPGMQPTATFAMPGAITDFLYTEDYSSGNGANSVVASSSGIGTTRPQSDPQLDLNQNRPLFEYRYNPTTDITNNATLNAHAARALKALANGSRTLTLSATVTKAPKLGKDWALGDDIGYSLGGFDSNGKDKVPAFPGGMKGIARCWGWELALAGDSIVTPILTLDDGVS